MFLVKKQIEEKDFVRLKDINERDNYDMLGAFINRLPEIENIENLKGLYQGHSGKMRSDVS